MIKTKKELREYLEADKIALGICLKKPRLFRDELWKYQRLYRKTEYYWNNRNKSIIHKAMAILMMLYYKKKSRERCCEIPINCIGKGLAIWHGYNIIINDTVKIGENFGISANTNIGQAHGKTPIIGDNVTMCLGSCVLGGIRICDNVTIGAKSLVLKDVTDEYVTIGGVPAKILKHHDKSKSLIKG